jgi:magnesium and cobalt transporter
MTDTEVIGGDTEDIDTLGGLVFSIAGRVPVRGELLHHSSGVEFEVLEADPRRIKFLRVLKPEPSRRRQKGD